MDKYFELIKTAAEAKTTISARIVQDLFPEAQIGKPRQSQMAAVAFNRAVRLGILKPTKHFERSNVRGKGPIRIYQSLLKHKGGQNDVP